MSFAVLNNSGFELQAAGPTIINGPIFGWRVTTAGTTVGIYAPDSTRYTSGPPQGANVAFIYSGPQNLAQYLPYRIVEGATYTVRAKFGWNKLAGSQPTYDLSLFAAETASLLANSGSPGAVAPATVQDNFVAASIPYTADATHAGKTLAIVISGVGAAQLDIDDVTLEVTNDPTWAGNDVWLDERAVGATPVVGTWTDFSQPQNSQYIDGTVRGITDPAQQYQWKPNIPVTGDYQVSVFIPFAAGTFSSAVTYTVIDAGSGGTKVIDQQASKGLWVDLGTFPFNAGNAGYVQSSLGGGVFVAADAVSWHRVASDTNAPVAGVQSPAAIGALGASGGAGAGLAGNQAASGLGVLGVQAEGGVQAPVDGISAAGQIGSLTAVVPGSETTVGIVGVQALTRLGALAARLVYEVPIQGVSARTELGEIRMVPGIWAPRPRPATNWAKDPESSTIWTKRPENEAEWLPGPKARE